MTQLDGQRADQDYSSDCVQLQRELDDARKTIRTLLRQVKKLQDQHAETTRAYNKTVANMVEIARENTALLRECELWRARSGGIDPEVDVDGLAPDISLEEAQAIRRAMARLHHPDAGGNLERMQMWNATLDQVEARLR